MDFATASRLVTSPDATAQDLTDICNAFPQLRASAAVHPNAHPELLNWLAQLGDPAVNAALAARAARQQPAQPQTGGGGTGWVWAIVVVLLAVIGFFVWRAMNPPDADPEPTPTETEMVTQEETDEATEEETEEPTTEETEEPTDDALGTIESLFPDVALAACVADTLGFAVTDRVAQEQLDAIGEENVAEFNLYLEEIGVDIVLDGGGLSCAPGASDAFSLDGIEHLTTLTTFGVTFETNVPQLDLSPLAKLEHLSYLSVGSNDSDGELKVTDIKRLENLEGANLVRVTQSSYSDLTKLENLTFVAIRAWAVEDFTFLLDIPALEVVGVGQDSGTLPADIQSQLEAKGVRVIELE